MHVNLAFKQFTNQSSTYPEHYSYNCVDGQFDPSFHSGSYGASTNNEYKPWILILFERPYIFQTIRILNRNILERRIGKLFIKSKLNAATYITNDYDDVEYQTFAYLENHFGAAESATFNKKRHHFAQTVVFYLDKTEYLTLCEVEIYNLRNFAKGKPTEQINQYGVGQPSKAVDGHSQWYYNIVWPKCTHTQFTLHNWWRVDLEKKIIIFAVSIIARDFPVRRNDFLIGVSNSSSVPTIEQPQICGRIPGRVPIYSTTRCPKWTVGQYVTIIKYSTDETPLELCEVDVFGEELGEETVLNVILYNHQLYFYQNVTRAKDCRGNTMDIFNITDYNKKSINFKLKGVGLKEACDNYGIFAGTDFDHETTDCVLSKTNDGYFTERDAYDTCVYDCNCYERKCNSLSIFYKKTFYFITKKIFAFLKI